MPKAKKTKKAAAKKTNQGDIISTGGFLTNTGSPKQQEIAKMATDLGETYDVKVSVRQVQLVQAAMRRIGGRVKNEGLKVAGEK